MEAKGGQTVAPVTISHYPPLKKKRIVACPKQAAGPAGSAFSKTDKKQKKQGSTPMNPETTAIVLIEYQNDFTTPGGVFHDGVKGVREKNKMREIRSKSRPRAAPRAPRSCTRR